MTVIVERNDRVGTTNMYKTLGLYLEEGKVVFGAHFSSPEPSDVSYSYGYEFEMEEYVRGVAELKEKGTCELNDTRQHYGGKLILSAVGGKSVSFSIPLEGPPDIYPYHFTSDWTVEDISLPQKDVVRAPSSII